MELNIQPEFINIWLFTSYMKNSHISIIQCASKFLAAILQQSVSVKSILHTSSHRNLAFLV